MDLIEKRYKIRNWHKFQYHKKPDPPWLRLYRKLIDDREWYELAAEDCRLLPLLWVLGSEDTTMQGLLPTLKDISFRVRISEEELDKRLQALSNWVEEVNVNTTLLQRSNNASETEAETETETETEVLKQHSHTLAEKMKTIASLRRVQHVDGRRLGQWSKAIRLMVTKDQIEIKDIEEGLEWYRVHWNDNQYIPRIESCIKLREKWDKLVAAMDREGKKNGDVKNSFTSQPSRVKLCSNCKDKLTCNMVMTTGHCGKHQWGD